jgi:hypothetical protein
MVFIGCLGSQRILPTLSFASLLPYGPQIAVRTSGQDIENSVGRAHGAVRRGTAQILYCTGFFAIDKSA